MYTHQTHTHTHRGGRIKELENDTLKIEGSIVTSPGDGRQDGGKRQHGLCHNLSRFSALPLLPRFYLRRTVSRGWEMVQVGGVEE